MKVAALIPAAGEGTRLGLGPKALLPLAGRSLLARSVAALAPFVDEVLVAMPAGLDLPPGFQARRIDGGGSRQQTVNLLLAAAQADWVLIHDAARPFLPAEVIQRVLRALEASLAVTAALPCADTLVRAQESDWGELLPRENVWAVQTPQGFHRLPLLEAHTRAQAEGHAATDDASLMARLGHRVALVPGDPRLFKVTHPADLSLAEALAGLWDAPPIPSSGSERSPSDPSPELSQEPHA